MLASGAFAKGMQGPAGVAWRIRFGMTQISTSTPSSTASTSPASRKKLIVLAALLLAGAAAGAYGWKQWQTAQESAGLVSGNGRIEATEVDVATKYAGRVAEISAQEGDFVTAGQTLARMQIGVVA